MSEKILVIDDQQKSLEEINVLLKENLKKYDFCVDRMTEWNHRTDYRLALLDIDMPGQSGFEIAKQLKQASPHIQIVFVTDYEDLVYQSFELSPLYFVRKSKLEEDLSKAMKVFLDLYERENAMYLLQYNGVIKEIPLQEIEVFEKQFNDLYIICHNETYRDRRNLKEIEERYYQYGFVRINSYQIVNVRKIQEITENNIRIHDRIYRISRRKSKEVRDTYCRYLR